MVTASGPAAASLLLPRLVPARALLQSRLGIDAEFCDALLKRRRSFQIQLFLICDTEAIEPSELRMLCLDLAPSEVARLADFQHHRDRVNFAICRVFLRRLFGMLTNANPCEVPIVIGPHGKPGLAGFLPAGQPWQFNLSHTRNAALIGISPRSAIGVDLEWIDPDLQWREIAGFCMTRDQIESLQGEPEAQCRQTFLTHWCQMESRLKASGKGLSGLDDSDRVHARPICLQVELPAGYVGSAALLLPESQDSVSV